MTSSSLNILIIEDADIIVNQLRILLSDKNSTHHIRSANSAELGLELIENLFPDVFIVDIKLPGISGIDLLNKIKQDYPSASPLIIMLTNMPHAIYKHACLSKGANFFLDKSRDFLVLPEILDSCFCSDDSQKVKFNPPNASLCNSPL
ncbi:two-component system response regulator [Sediminibacterium sp.]|jgi:DNA-binding NarL/FixJ family response regulator|uniref:response regulator n=1 Tax=Sediminibacterium sp. TaxID=1917865 RepID=UPI0025FE998A|nr:response regulator [Sediminibacterium sp.]MDO8996624.1 response regulator [Sediminibacterium sp.]MDO9157753.1 response regulator [Sediminibacterium sp.]MDP1971821.1 response regulator [Sediminibacterium sp.]MDP2421160.1 response regulator [Sediminibacterium sp.]